MNVHVQLRSSRQRPCECSVGVEAKPERSEPEGSSTGAGRAAAGTALTIMVKHGLAIGPRRQPLLPYGHFLVTSLRGYPLGPIGANAPFISGIIIIYKIK